MLTKKSQNIEKGGVIVEFAFILPILFGLCFMGYNIVRQIEIQIVKRNISHTLASAYACSFQPKDGIAGPDYAEICFQNVFNILALIEGNVAGKTSYAVTIYRPIDVANPPAIDRQNNNCDDSAAILDSVIAPYKSKKSKPGNDYFKFTPPEPALGPQPPGPLPPLTLRTILSNQYSDNSAEMKAIARQYCLNNFTIMLTEFNILEAPFFNFGDQRANAYYEFGII